MPATKSYTLQRITYQMDESEVQAFIVRHHKELNAKLKDKIMRHEEKGKLALFTISNGKECTEIRDTWNQLYSECVLELMENNKEN